MDPLDLNIEQCMLINIHITLLLDPFHQPPLIHLLDGLPFGLELGLVTVFLQFPEFIHIGQPLVRVQFLTVKLGETRVGAGDPSAGCDSVGYVYELVGEDLEEGAEERAF